MGASRPVKRGLLLHNALFGADEMVELGVAAERSGWDGVFLMDHLVYPFNATSPEQHIDHIDPWIALSGIAARTTSIRLGTWVTPLPRRQPWQMAKDLATLDRLSNGRVILGAGLGARPDYEMIGQTWAPRELAGKLDEALEILAGLWTGQPFSFTGDYYTINEVALRPAPLQEPRIPIMLGCWWPHMKPIRRGARWDGIMPNWPAMFQGDQNEEQLREMLDYYHSVTEDPGEILVPADPVGATAGFVDMCTRLGVTWFLTTNVGKPDMRELASRLAQEGPTR